MTGSSHVFLNSGFPTQSESGLRKPTEKSGSDPGPLHSGHEADDEQERMSPRKQPIKVILTAKARKPSALKVRARTCCLQRSRVRVRLRVAIVFWLRFGSAVFIKDTARLFSPRELSARLGIALQICLVQCANTLLFGMDMAGGSVARGLTRTRQLSIWQTPDSCLKDLTARSYDSV